MVKNRRSIYARKIIKEILYETPCTAQQLVNKLKNKFKNSKSSREIAMICTTDSEIQVMYPDGNAARWSLRSTILDNWGDDKYFLKKEVKYLTMRAKADNIHPSRKSEFEFFKSLRDIISEEE